MGGHATWQPFAFGWATLAIAILGASVYRPEGIVPAGGHRGGTPWTGGRTVRALRRMGSGYLDGFQHGIRGRDEERDLMGEAALFIARDLAARKITAGQNTEANLRHGW
jgi:hypothetical protein